MTNTTNTTNAGTVQHDEDAIRELLLFFRNCRAVYIGTTRGENVPGPVLTGKGLKQMEHCICNHIIKGEYTDEDAEKGISNVVDFAAKIYNRIFGAGNGFGCFSVDTRREAARRYVEDNKSD